MRRDFWRATPDLVHRGRRSACGVGSRGRWSGDHRPFGLCPDGGAPAVREGVAVVEQHCYVQSGTRLVGPLYVGPGSELLGGPIRGSVIGPRCRVRGELSTSVFLGYANKAHDGFVGHTVVGRWANLSAG